MFARLLLSLCTGALVLHALPSHACSRIAVSSTTGLATLPLDGRMAPRNTRVWIVTEAGSTIELINALGETVTTTRTDITVQGEARENVAMLTPMSELAPGEYRLRTPSGILSRFTVIDERDTTPPDALTVTPGEVSGAHFGAYSCGAPSLAALGLSPHADLAFAVPEGTTWPSQSVLAAARGDRMQLTSLADGAHRFRVLHVDLAGNVAESELTALNVPVKTSGCSAGGPFVLLGLAALTLRARSTRRRSNA